MPSQVQLYNRALYLVGDKRVASPTVNAERANILDDIYALTRDMVTRDHPWNSAMAREALAADGTAPAFGFARRFDQPRSPDWCLKVWGLDKDAHPKGIFKVEGRWILTDEPAPLKIHFAKRLTDPEEIDPMLAEAIAARLAHGACYRITQSRTHTADLWKYYEATLVAARSADGGEGSMDQLEESSLAEARR